MNATTTAPILIAGIGNIFFGDDAFGSEVARRLAARQCPDDVCVIDFGIRGMDLAYALLDPHQAVVLLDAAPRGGRPGTLYVLEIRPADASGADEQASLVEPHTTDVAKVLRHMRALGGNVEHLFLVGCEPGSAMNVEEMQMGMSSEVEAAVDKAVTLVEGLVNRLRQGQPITENAVKL